MGFHKAVLVLGVALLLSGCELLSQATPTATPVPTATPTPTPPYWPTYADFDLAVRLKSSETPRRLPISPRYYPDYAAIYAALECFAGNPLTHEGFMSFVDQTVFMRASADSLWSKAGWPLEAVLLREVVGKMLALSDKDVRGSCIEPFLYPKTGAEASLSAWLVMGYMRRSIGDLAASKLLDPSARDIASRYAAEWFQQDAQSREPFILWFWNRERLGPLTQFPSDVPVPRGGAWTPTWALEFQLGIEQAISL